jgi:hypothetical protein
MLSRNTMVKFLNVMGGLKEISLNRMVLNYEKKKTLLPILIVFVRSNQKELDLWGSTLLRKHLWWKTLTPPPPVSCSYLKAISMVETIHDAKETTSVKIIYRNCLAQC